MRSKRSIYRCLKKYSRKKKLSKRKKRKLRTYKRRSIRTKNLTRKNTKRIKGGMEEGESRECLRCEMSKPASEFKDDSKTCKSCTEQIRCDKVLARKTTQAREGGYGSRTTCRRGPISQEQCPIIARGDVCIRPQPSCRFTHPMGWHFNRIKRMWEITEEESRKKEEEAMDQDFEELMKEISAEGEAMSATGVYSFFEDEEAADVLERELSVKPSQPDAAGGGAAGGGAAGGGASGAAARGGDIGIITGLRNKSASLRETLITLSPEEIETQLYSNEQLIVAQGLIDRISAIEEEDKEDKEILIALILEIVESNDMEHFFRRSRDWGRIIAQMLVHKVGAVRLGVISAIFSYQTFNSETFKEFCDMNPDEMISDLQGFPVPPNMSDDQKITEEEAKHLKDILKYESTQQHLFRGW